MSYGIHNVIGGFGKPLTYEQMIPYSIARTRIENRDLFSAIVGSGVMRGHGMTSLEVGCGYGRHLWVLGSFTKNFAFEADEELAKIAQELNPDSNVIHGTILENFVFLMQFDLILTFTFLQHLKEDELKKYVAKIYQMTKKGGCLVVVEETDPEITDKTTTGRTIEQYSKLFVDFKLVSSEPRVLEPTFPKKNSGHYMVFVKE